jgi:hypothetical protein
LPGIFHITFNYLDHAYHALVTITGPAKDSGRFNIHTGRDTIQISMPTGRLVFAIPEVIERLSHEDESAEKPEVMLTGNISIQLMNRVPLTGHGTN